MLAMRCSRPLTPVYEYVQASRLFSCSLIAWTFFLRAPRLWQSLVVCAFPVELQQVQEQIVEVLWFFGVEQNDFPAIVLVILGAAERLATHSGAVRRRSRGQVFASGTPLRHTVELFLSRWWSAVPQGRICVTQWSCSRSGWPQDLPLNISRVADSAAEPGLARSREAAPRNVAEFPLATGFNCLIEWRRPCCTAV